MLSIPTLTPTPLPIQQPQPPQQPPPPQPQPQILHYFPNNFLQQEQQSGVSPLPISLLSHERRNRRKVLKERKRWEGVNYSNGNDNFNYRTNSCSFTEEVEAKNRNSTYNGSLIICEEQSKTSCTRRQQQDCNCEKAAYVYPVSWPFLSHYPADNDNDNDNDKTKDRRPRE